MLLVGKRGKEESQCDDEGLRVGGREGGRQKERAAEREGGREGGRKKGEKVSHSLSVLLYHLYQGESFATQDLNILYFIDLK